MTSPSPLSLLPRETLLQIVQQVSDNDLLLSSQTHKSEPSHFNASSLSRPTLHTLLFIKLFSPFASLILNQNIALIGPNLSKPRKFPATLRLISRILDPNDRIREAIRELVVCDWEYAEYDDRTAGLVTAKYLEDVIFAVSADSLRVLKTPNLKGCGAKWNAESLGRLNERFPRLEELFVVMDLEVEKQPQSFLKALSHFSSLETLTLRLLHQNYSNTRGSPQVSVCHKIATDLFRSFFAFNPASKLKTIQLVVLKWENIPIQDVILYTVVVGVRKSHSSGKKGKEEVEWKKGGEEEGEVGFDVQVSNGMGGGVGAENESILRFLGRL